MNPTNAIRSAILTLAVLGLTITASTTTAKAADNFFAVTTIVNRTTVPVNYACRWETPGAEWQSFTLLPGHSRDHYWRHAYPNQNSSPILQVRFDCDLGPESRIEVKSLKSYASPDDGSQYSKRYGFQVVDFDRELDLLGEN